MPWGVLTEPSTARSGRLREAIRQARAAFKAGRISQSEYEHAMRAFVAESVQVQEDLGLDVLVHGEPERNDEGLEPTPPIEAAPPPVEPDQQVLDDASATGMTSRLTRGQSSSDDDAPVDTRTERIHQCRKCSTRLRA